MPESDAVIEQGRLLLGPSRGPTTTIIMAMAALSSAWARPTDTAMLARIATADTVIAARSGAIPAITGAPTITTTTGAITGVTTAGTIASITGAAAIDSGSGTLRAAGSSQRTVKSKLSRYSRA